MKLRNFQLERQLMCARKDSPSSDSKYCKLYKEINLNSETCIGRNDARFKICNGCSKDIKEYYINYYNINLNNNNKINKVNYARGEIDFMDSKACQYHSSCLEDLKEFQDCEFDYNEIYRGDGDFSN
eukprot:jgi/Orpsp1_1/1192735/evm.model.d7180000095519.1